MSAGVDVQAVLRLLSANVEFPSLKREASEASDAVSDLLGAAEKARKALSELITTGDRVVFETALSALDEAIAKATRGAS